MQGAEARFDAPSVQDPSQFGLDGRQCKVATDPVKRGKITEWCCLVRKPAREAEHLKTD